MAGIIGKNGRSANLRRQEPTPEPTPRQKVPGYGQKAGVYEKKAPGFGQKAPGFGQKAPGFGRIPKTCYPHYVVENAAADTDESGAVDIVDITLMIKALQYK